MKAKRDNKISTSEDAVASHVQQRQAATLNITGIKAAGGTGNGIQHSAERIKNESRGTVALGDQNVFNRGLYQKRKNQQFQTDKLATDQYHGIASQNKTPQKLLIGSRGTSQQQPTRLIKNPMAHVQTGCVSLERGGIKKDNIVQIDSLFREQINASARNLVHKTSPDSNQLIREAQQRATANTGGGKASKLFIQEFYNMKKNKKRDLAGFSLHNHPDSYLDGIFSNWHASETKSSRRGGTAEHEPIPYNETNNSSRDVKLRKMQQNYLTKRRMTPSTTNFSHSRIDKIQNGSKTNQQPFKIQYGVEIFENTIAQREPALPEISVQDFIYTDQDQRESYDHGTRIQLKKQLYSQSDIYSHHSEDKRIKMAPQYDYGDQQARKSLGWQSSGHSPGGPPNPFQSNAKAKAASGNLEFMRLTEDKIGKSPNMMDSIGKASVPIFSQQSQNAHQYQQMMSMKQNRHRTSNVHMFKNMHREIYGSSEIQNPPKSNILINQASSRMRGNFMTCNSSRAKLDKKIPLRTTMKGDRVQTEEKPRIQPNKSFKVRHPDLKHEIKGVPVTHMEAKLNMFARDQPLFNQTALSQDQIDVHEKVAKLPAPVRQQPTKAEQLQRVFRANEIAQIKLVNEAEQEVEYDFNDMKIGISDIKDQKGFEKRVENKLEEMVNPQSSQVFQVEDSKQLYQVVNKHLQKTKDWKAKMEHKAKKKNVTEEPPPLKTQSTRRRKSRKNAHFNTLEPESTISSSKSRSPLSRKHSIRSSRSSFKVSPVKSSKSSTKQLNQQNKVIKRQSTISRTQQSPLRQVQQKEELAFQRQAQNVQQPAQLRSQSTLRKTSNLKRQETTRPNYFAMKGQISLAALKDRLERDLFQNMNLAEKMGVMRVLLDIHYDSNSKMQWRERRRMQELPIELDPSELIDTEFPGYQEQMEKTQHALAMQRLAEELNRIEHSPEKIGIRSEFNFREESKVDLPQIFDIFQRDGLREFSEEMFNDLVSRNEVIAFLTLIRNNRLKNGDDKISEQEQELADYIKYLIGEMRNKDFSFKREDFSQRHELNTKSLKMPFDEYAQQEENAMKTVANDIIERVDYNTVVMNCNGPSSVKYISNPKFAYFQICQKDSDLAIPLLAKVVNRQLSLMNYQLSIGHMKALVRTFDFNKQFVSRFLFQSCGLSDAHLAILLEGLEKLENVNSLVLKKEEFGVKSVELIRPLIVRPRPYNLQELRLIDCRTPPQVTRQLITILRQANQLKVLSLVNAKISEASMEELGLMIAESTRISELDISWNLLKPQNYSTLLAGLGSNKTLLSLNLSWNRICDSNEFFDEIVIDSARARMGMQPTSPRPKEWFEKPVRFTEQSQSVVDNICFIIKRNKKLQHVNLTNTGLTEYMMLAIGTAMRRAKSLVSIHLCSNPGSTQRVKQYLHSRVRCIKEHEIVQFPVSQMVDELTKNVNRDILIRQLTDGQEQEGEKAVARETIKIKQNMQRKRIHSLVNEFADDQTSDSRMIFTRILGHKVDMPGSGQWKLITDKREDCWVCDLEVYGLVFWDYEKIAEKAYMSTTRAHQENVMRNVIDELHKVTSKEEEDRVAEENPRVPIVMGDFTNWKPKPFFEITEYSEILFQQFDIEHIIRQMQYERVLGYRKSDQDQFTETDWFNYKQYIGQFFERFVPSPWKQVIQKNLIYKKPHMIHAADTRPDFYKQLFMMAAMFKVGKHDFIVRAPQQIFDRANSKYVDNIIASGQPDYMYFTNVSDIRAEDVHPFVKHSNTKSITRKFNKETSVFAQWKEDTLSSVEQTFKIDWEQTKIPKIIKDFGDLHKTRDYLNQNYAFFKELYLNLQYNSVYPFVNKLETASFCERALLVDSVLNTSNCDLLFVSCNTTNKGGIKQKTGLLRCEFLEYIVRLANFKYIQTNQVPTFYEAVKKVFEEFVRPNLNLLPWQEFRDDELWTIEVNDVLDANLEGVQKLHNYYFSPTQKFMSDKDGINLLSRDVFLELTYQQAKFCLTFCKMPMKDEIADFEKYHKLQVVELLEMIGRAAKVKYQNTEFDEEPLAKKIEMVLDLLFPLVKYRRCEVFNDAESASASDDDY